MLHGPLFRDEDFAAIEPLINLSILFNYNEMQQEDQDKFALEGNKVDPGLFYSTKTKERVMDFTGSHGLCQILRYCQR